MLKKRILNKIVLTLCTILPLPTVTFAVGHADLERPAQLEKANWIDLYNKLVQGQVPDSYYEFLQANGVSDLDTLPTLSETARGTLLNQFNKDRSIMLSGPGSTRSL